MISVLFIGSLYWSVSASYQQRDGVHAVYSNVLVNRRNKNASSRKVWSGWPVDWSEFHIWPLNLMVVSHHWWQDKVSLECRSQSTRPQSSAFVFFLRLAGVNSSQCCPLAGLWRFPCVEGVPSGTSSPHQSTDTWGLRSGTLVYLSNLQLGLALKSPKFIWKNFPQSTFDTLLGGQVDLGYKDNHSWALNFF